MTEGERQAPVLLLSLGPEAVLRGPKGPPLLAFPKELSLPDGWKINVSSEHQRLSPPLGGPLDARAAGDPRGA